MNKLGWPYEVLPTMRHERDEDSETLSASFTPNNGIRLQIINDDLNPGEYAVFDFSPDEARLIGAALTRWANDHDADVAKWKAA